jgi:hypothetical protein
MVDFRKAAGPDDKLFDIPADEQFGATTAGGWHGLVWTAGERGGVILYQDDVGRREVAEALSDEELAARWRQLTGDTPARPVSR